MTTSLSTKESKSSFSLTKLIFLYRLSMKIYEEFGALALCTAFVAKAPFFKSSLTRNFFLGLGLHLTSSIALYGLSKSFISSFVEPRFVVQDNLVGELAEKYKFTVEDFSQTMEEAQQEQIRQEQRFTNVVEKLSNQVRFWMKKEPMEISR